MKQDLVADLINALTILPGVGKKSAQRMALYLLDRNKDGASILANTLSGALDNIQRCESCRMLTSNNLCKICLDTARDIKKICVVESPSDVLAIESTGGYRGKYFVLLGRLSPIDGIGPEELGINDLLSMKKRRNSRNYSSNKQHSRGRRNSNIHYGSCQKCKSLKNFLWYSNWWRVRVC
jgi:recombination protein RecR